MHCAEKRPIPNSKKVFLFAMNRVLLKGVVKNLQGTQTPGISSFLFDLLDLLVTTSSAFEGLSYLQYGVLEAKIPKDCQLVFWILLFK